ncbi:MAG TPA: SRPBCC family protein [Methylovirgula sp.]
MSATVTIAPIRKTLHVDLPQAKAFDLFTRGIDRWWPRTHHIDPSPLKKAVIEPFAGGRWYHLCEDGNESNFGHVLVWQEPERLTLAWQFDSDFHYDPKIVSEVDLHFVAENARRTRVEFEHRNIDRLGAGAESFREKVMGGWPTVFENFVKCADSAS